MCLEQVAYVLIAKIRCLQSTVAGIGGHAIDTCVLHIAREVQGGLVQAEASLEQWSHHDLAQTAMRPTKQVIVGHVVCTVQEGEGLIVCSVQSSLNFFFRRNMLKYIFCLLTEGPHDLDMDVNSYHV